MEIRSIIMHKNPRQANHRQAVRNVLDIVTRSVSEAGAGILEIVTRRVSFEVAHSPQSPFGRRPNRIILQTAPPDSVLFAVV